LKAKCTEDELEEARSKLPAFQQELVGYKVQIDGLQKRVKEAESALIEARVAFDQEKQAWQGELLQRIDEERQKWLDEAAGQGSFDPSRANSPVTSTRRGLTSEFLGLQNLQIRRASARSINSDIPPVDRLPSRRPSAQPAGRLSGPATPGRQDSMQSITTNNEGPDAPSVHTDNDDVFETYASPASPHQTINEMVSVSTAAAGPSIQLVERMSSAVRRLETEKAASKDDLARLISQRDEARAEIISLMKEVEAARAANSKVAELEAEIAAINGRYETTLEMLGEKSERVDELESDIVDLKDMYRELVERTVK
jgi:flagellin-like hook-associated protein FlgL